MPRHRRMLAPINTVKHYVTRTNTDTASAAVANTIWINAVVAPATGTTADVKEGSIVKAIHIEMWIQGSGTTGLDTQFNFAIYKAPAGIAAFTAAEMVNLGGTANKKNIFFVSQGVIGAGIDGNQSIPIFNAWLLIPKGKQRFGLGDRLFSTFTPTGTSCQNCGIATYKEFT